MTGKPHQRYTYRCPMHKIKGRPFTVPVAFRALTSNRWSSSLHYSPSLHLRLPQHAAGCRSLILFGGPPVDVTGAISPHSTLRNGLSIEVVIRHRLRAWERCAVAFCCCGRLRLSRQTVRSAASAPWRHPLAQASCKPITVP